jgi:hypothetical protein
VIDAAAPENQLRVTARRMASMLTPQTKAQLHRGGVPCDGLDVAAGLAAGDEDFGIKTDGDREQAGSRTAGRRSLRPGAGEGSA